jgi:hypothetical protein
MQMPVPSLNKGSQMDHKLFSLDRDLLSSLTKPLEWRTASNMPLEETAAAQEAIFQLPQKNLTLGSADLASFWQNLE